jgi:hypothetical protein
MNDQVGPLTERITKTLRAEVVTFCVDTNLLVEFQSLDTIPWRDLAPNATEINIVVPTKVAEEMDAHKKKTGRLGRRGIEFASVARAIEDSPDQRIDLRVHNPRVTVAFGPVFRRTELDGDLYELDDPDGRVVAEVAAIIKSRPEAILLTDDSKPIRLAKHTGLAHIRPLEAWRRAEGPDERDAKIAELQRELGAQPLLVVGLPDAVDDRGTHIIQPPPEAACSSCLAALISAALSVDKMVPRDEIIRRHGLAQPGPFGLSALSMYEDGVTTQSLLEYEEEYRDFERRVREWAELVPSLIIRHGAMLPINIDVGNDGDRAAERVQVELKLTRDFRFAPLDLFEEALEGILEPPRPPEPNRNFVSSFLPDLVRPERHRADVFYSQDGPSSNLDATSISWRCEELRQGAHYLLTALIIAAKPNARGALRIQVSSAVIAKPTGTTAPLVARAEASTEQLSSYLARRVRVMPEKYQAAIVEALSAHTGPCTND